MLTSRGTEKDRAEGLEAGANAYLVKPLKVDEMDAQISAAMTKLGIPAAS